MPYKLAYPEFIRSPVHSSVRSFLPPSLLTPHPQALPLLQAPELQCTHGFSPHGPFSPKCPSLCSFLEQFHPPCVFFPVGHTAQASSTPSLGYSKSKPVSSLGTTRHCQILNCLTPFCFISDFQTGLGIKDSARMMPRNLWEGDM